MGHEALSIVPRIRLLVRRVETWQELLLLLVLLLLLLLLLLLFSFEMRGGRARASGCRRLPADSLQGRSELSLRCEEVYAALREKFGLFFSWLEVDSSLRMRFAGSGGHCVIVERLSMYNGSEMGEGSEADDELRSHHLVEA